MNLNFVNKCMLAPNKLQINDLEYILGMTDQSKIDYAELYLQSYLHENWILEDSMIKSGSYNMNNGAGIRVIVGDRTGFAYTNQLTLDTLKHSMKNAIGVVNNNDKFHYLANYRKSKLVFSEFNECCSIYPNIV